MMIFKVGICLATFSSVGSWQAARLLAPPTTTAGESRRILCPSHYLLMEGAEIRKHE